MEIEHEGHPAHRLIAGDLEAVFVPSVGMVGASLTHLGKELLPQRAGLAAYAERGKTFGIPLLHPWANRLGGDTYTAANRTVDLAHAPNLRRDPEHQVPIHGLLAASPHWQVTGASDKVLSATLDYGAREDLLNGFPFPHTLTITATLSPDALTVDTTIEATNDTPVPIAFGWHPYFQLPGVPRQEWDLKLPARKQILVDDRQIPTGETRAAAREDGPLGDRAYDDGYAEIEPPPTFTLTGGGRTIDVVFDAGYPVAQIFAPPGQGLVAIEPMTAPADALRSHTGLQLLDPGAVFTARFSIRVRKA